MVAGHLAVRHADHENIETIYHKTEEGEQPKTVCKETVKYFFGCSDSILPSVIFGHLQNFMKIIPNSRHKHLASIIEALKTEFKEMLGNDGVFLYPTFPNTAHQHYQIYHKLPSPCTWPSSTRLACRLPTA